MRSPETRPTQRAGAPDAGTPAATQMATCTLCDLPTPDPPVTADDVDGGFCCEGCLHVHREVGDVDPASLDDTDEGRDADVADAADETAFLRVDGMHCATCELYVGSRAREVDGVADAEASYASDLLRVAHDGGDGTVEAVVDAVSGVGYHVRRPEADSSSTDGLGEFVTAFRLLVGFFMAMGVMAWYGIYLYPRYLGLDALGARAGTIGIPETAYYIWLMTTVALVVTGGPILRGAYVSLRSRAPDMDLLVALAAVNAYLYSTLVLLTGGTHIYFDIAIVIVLVVSVGNHYEDVVKRRANGTLAALTEERVDEARRLDDDASAAAALDRVAVASPDEDPDLDADDRTDTATVSVDDLAPGDVVVVAPGERLPVDGTVVAGTAAVDESLVTGEAVPVRKREGDEVVGGATVTDGPLAVEVPDTPASSYDRLVEMLWRVQSGRPGAQRVADRVAAVFVPAVLGLAAVAAMAHLALGAAPPDALLTGLAVLVVSCPCALGLATPLAVASGLEEALDRGVVATSGAVVEDAPRVDTVVLDKTGTLTTGDMRLRDDGQHPRPDDEALIRAAAVEQRSSHPIADAILDAAPDDAVADREAAEYEAHPGMGVSASVDGERVVVGRPALFEARGWRVTDEARDRAEAARDAGDVPVCIGWDGAVRATAVVGDEPRAGWRDAVAALGADARVHVLTGDHRRAAERFGDHPDVAEVFAGVPPDAKAETVRRLRGDGTVAMVGDGTNDAPALAEADVGVALASGTAVAADAADLVVTTDELGDVPAAFALTRATRRRIRQNLGWAFVYNTVAIPLAALGLINPLFAAVAMGTSSLLVVGNSLRALRDGDAEHSVLRRLVPRWPARGPTSP